MSVYAELQTALRELEAAMKAANLWRVPTPDASAFESQEPFCVDTMSLPQWVRFVFVTRLDALAEAKGPLPAKCDVAPAMAAYLIQEKVRASDHLLVVRAFEKVDQLITDN
ncbi:YqcC family protein [Vreelandella nanhaiensis]|uniref:YqcC family protein n=1 Tax=Vreelandella nanhaiensis TaxID=1258546 RepID=A0A433KLK1_9GAMM|nr:YqcC family protein [Halomonas nanhaiensis]RUR30709.1 YqcC family protein [Halomonas nanhaiensis]